jgi:hypothetical protein
MNDPGSAVLAEAARHGKITVAAFVRNLARTHSVVYQPKALDAFAAAISRLSDAEVHPDKIENLLIALTRAAIVTEQQRFQLHGRN